MPKIREDDDIPDYDPTEEEGEYEDDMPPPLPTRRRGRKPTTPQQVRRPQPRVPQQPPRKRYVAFSQQERHGIMDAETEELVGESVWEVLAEIKTDLEELKNMIGSMVG